jgi:ABC-type dipeptide/oligopeptide/nickel transport system permease component
MRYVFVRLVELVPILLGVSVLIFMLTRLGPADPARMILGLDAPEAEVIQLRHSLGLDQPLLVQYVHWLGDTLQGNLGKSYKYGTPVAAELAQRFPASLILAIASVTVTIAVGIPLGIVSAIRRAQWIDYAILLLSLVGVSAPVFLLGFLLIFFLSYSLPVFPTAGATTPLHLVLPAITLGLPSAAVVVRLTRTSMLEVLNEDYVRTATAKGLRRRVVLVRHALRNALIPVITIVGLQFGFLLNGSIIVEQVFAWPGIGSLIVNAASLGDFPVLQGATLLFTLTFVVVNLTVDLVCGMVDPRVRTATDER